MQRVRPPVVLAALALLGGAGCNDRPLTGADAQQALQGAGVRAPQPQSRVWTSDDEFARVARAEVPGFAGYYLDSDGTPVILLKDHRQKQAAESYLATLLEDARKGLGGGAPRAAVIRKVTHDFADLKGWADRVRPLMAREDVFMLDVDEVGNKVFVGVLDQAAVRLVRREAARLGVPPGVLRVEVRPVPAPRITLAERTTFLAGGFKIQGPPDSNSARICSLGFNAVYQGSWVFVTASHCTWRMFANDAALITQPTYVAGNEIGTEVRDRAEYLCWTDGYLCRLSDAAYIQHNGTRTIGQGKIAYTDMATGAPAPNLTVRGDWDVIRRFPSGHPPIGTTLTKTGHASGTTFGTVTEQCVDVDSQYEGRWWYFSCLDVSNIYSQGGDSGAPVYRRVSTTQVELYGIVQGGPPLDPYTTFSSRLGYIEQELGALSNLCVPGYGC